MIFDIRSAVLGLAVGNLVFGLILLLFQFGVERPQRIPFLTTGKLLQGVGWLLLYGRGDLPDWLSFTVGNILLIVGTANDSWAMYRIAQRPVSRALQITSVAGVSVVCLLATPLSAAGRVAVSSFAVMIFFALGGYAMLSSASGNSLLRRYIGASMWLMVVVTGVRGAWAAVTPDYFTLFAGNTIQLIMFAALYCLMLTNGFGLLLLIKHSADRELRDSEARFRSYFDLPLTGRAITSPDKGWIDVNTTLCEMLGYARAELMSMTWAELTHPDDIAADLVQFNRVMAGEIDGYTLEKRFLCKDGSIIHTQLVVQCLRRPDRSVDYFVAQIQNITERQQAEAALRESETQYRLSEAELRRAQSVAHLGNWKWDLRTKEVTWSDEMYRIFGIDKSSYTGRLGGAIQKVIHPDDLHLVLPSNATSFLDNRPVEYRIIWPDGSIRHIWAVSGEATVDADGRPIFMTGIAQDITERKQMEAALRDLNSTLEQRVADRTAELRAANARLTELDHLKDEFLSRIGHELRTPLAGILIALELLETARPDKRERFMLRLKQSTERLRDMIEDVLMFSQLDLYTQPDILGLINLNEIVERLFVSRQTLSTGHDLRLQLNLAHNLPPVQTDGELIRQALNRLLVNAVNYTPAGSVILSTAPRDDNGQHWVTVSVADSGPGITPGDLPHIFERFYRGRAAADYKTPGTGVGLSICHEIAQKLGGRITVTTQVGAGSTFTIWLPLAR